MDSGSIKSGGGLRPQDLGSRQQVRRTTQSRGNADGAPAQVSRPHSRERFADPENLVSANGRTYDRAAPKGTYLNIMV